MNILYVFISNISMHVTEKVKANKRMTRFHIHVKKSLQSIPVDNWAKSVTHGVSVIELIRKGTKTEYVSCHDVIKIVDTQLRKVVYRDEIAFTCIPPQGPVSTLFGGSTVNVCFIGRIDVTMYEHDREMVRVVGTDHTLGQIRVLIKRKDMGVMQCKMPSFEVDHVRSRRRDDAPTKPYTHRGEVLLTFDPAHPSWVGIFAPNGKFIGNCGIQHTWLQAHAPLD